MSLFDILAAARRQFLTIVVVLLATAAAAYGVYSQVPVYYQSDASMIVLLPNVQLVEGETVVPVNPYSTLGAQSAQVAASALASVAAGEDFQNALIARGVSSDTSVEVAPLYGGGVVMALSAVNQDGAAAQADLAVVSLELTRTLSDRQIDAGAPKGTLLSIRDLNTATTPATLDSSRTKLSGVTVAIGLIVAAVAVILLERLRVVRTSRRHGARRRGGAAEVPAVPGAPAAAAAAAAAASAGSAAPEAGRRDWADADADADAAVDAWSLDEPLVTQRR